MALGGGPWRRRENRVNGDFDGVFDHRGNEPGQVGARQREARIRIDLDEIGFEGLVDHEVVAEQFEGVVSSLGVHFVIGGSDSVARDLFNLRQHFFKKGAALHASQIIQIPLKIVVAEFIPAFVFPVLVAFFLDCVIG